jgi:hypothetical protein
MRRGEFIKELLDQRRRGLWRPFAAAHQQVAINAPEDDLFSDYSAAAAAEGKSSAHLTQLRPAALAS